MVALNAISVITMNQLIISSSHVLLLIARVIWACIAKSLQTLLSVGLGWIDGSLKEGKCSLESSCHLLGNMESKKQSMF